MNGVVKAARRAEDFRPFEEPPPPPPFPSFESPGRIDPRSSKGATSIPKHRIAEDLLARATHPPPKFRDQELQRRRKGGLRRRERSPSYDDDSAYSSDNSYHSPRNGKSKSSDSGKKKSGGSDSRESSGPGSKKSSGSGSNKTGGSGGDPAARRKQLDQKFQNEKPGIIKGLEEVITPLRVGILLGCFDLIGGS